MKETYLIRLQKLIISKLAVLKENKYLRKVLPYNTNSIPQLNIRLPIMVFVSLLITGFMLLALDP